MGNGDPVLAALAEQVECYRRLSKLAAIVLKPFAHDGYLRRMPPPFGNWTKFRNFPRPRPHRRPSPAPDDRVS